MGFYPTVNTGEQFKPNKSLENDIRGIVNTLNGFSDKPVKKAQSGGDNGDNDVYIAHVVDDGINHVLPLGVVCSLRKVNDPADTKEKLGHVYFPQQDLEDFAKIGISFFVYRTEVLVLGIDSQNEEAIKWEQDNK